MCIVSMIQDAWKTPGGPNYIAPITYSKDPELAKHMLEVLEKLEKIDKRLDKLEQCKFSASEKQKFKDELKRIADSYPTK